MAAAAATQAGWCTWQHDGAVVQAIARAGVHGEPGTMTWLCSMLRWLCAAASTRQVAVIWGNLLTQVLLENANVADDTILSLPDQAKAASELALLDLTQRGCTLLELIQS